MLLICDDFKSILAESSSEHSSHPIRPRERGKQLVACGGVYKQHGRPWGRGLKSLEKGGCSRRSGASREGDALELFEPEVGKGFLMVLVGRRRGQGCGEDFRKRSKVRASEREGERPTHDLQLVWPRSEGAKGGSRPRGQRWGPLRLETVQGGPPATRDPSVQG